MALLRDVTNSYRRGIVQLRYDRTKTFHRYVMVKATMDVTFLYCVKIN